MVPEPLQQGYNEYYRSYVENGFDEQIGIIYLPNPIEIN